MISMHFPSISNWLYKWSEAPRRATSPWPGCCCTWRSTRPSVASCPLEDVLGLLGLGSHRSLVLRIQPTFNQWTSHFLYPEVLDFSFQDSSASSREFTSISGQACQSEAAEVHAGTGAKEEGLSLGDVTTWERPHHRKPWFDAWGSSYVSPGATTYTDLI